MGKSKKKNKANKSVNVVEEKECEKTNENVEETSQREGRSISSSSKPSPVTTCTPKDDPKVIKRSDDDKDSLKQKGEGTPLSSEKGISGLCPSGSKDTRPKCKSIVLM